ncbi:MAG: hypothetical protein N2999_05790 [Proteobacteria bacterium]|nr:hypothetical protein [Pseudomonadota bacterium]
MTTYRALLCDEHGFYDIDREKCAICGSWPAQNQALLCGGCGFLSSDREKCAVCGKWPARHPAMVCDNHKGRCVKCGKYI